MTKSTKFICDAVSRVEDHSISLPATDTVMLNTLVTVHHRQIFTVKGGNGSNLDSLALGLYSV